LKTLNKKILRKFTITPKQAIGNNVVVTGIIDSDHPIRSKNKKDVDLIFFKSLITPRGINDDYILNNQLNIENQYKFFD
jgi:hypothetical protein